MNSLWRMLGRAPVRPSLVETDDVYPLHMLDDTKTMRGIVITWTLRFDDVLDADKLHDGLSRLLDIGDWRKLGGRLRLNKNGALEVHVPRPFTAERPAVTYSCEKLDVGINDHELGWALPQATDKLSMHFDPEHFRAFAARADAPQTINDFIYHDVPLLSLHVTVFKNATLVGLSWPHVLMDVMGQQALLRAWSSVLSGREADVPPVLGAHEDALCSAAATEPGEAEELEVAKQQIKGLGLLSFGLRFAWDLMTGPAAETRTIYMPATTVEALRHEAEADLATTAEVPYLSDNDLLTAWAARVVALSQPHPRPITVLHAVNARFRLSALSQAPGVFIQNMVVAGHNFLGAAEATGSLGLIALANRQQLRTQLTEGQVKAFVQGLQQDAAGGDPRILCGPSDAVLLPMTNWERADVLSSADFGAAVVRPGRISTSGRITYHHAASMGPLKFKNVFVVMGKDREGGYWLTANLAPAAWDVIAKQT